MFTTDVLRSEDLRKRVRIVAAAVSGIFLCVNVSAQTNDDTDYPLAGQAKEIVVTASRSAEDANKVAAQITVITAAEIAESGAQNLVDVLAKVPGVRFSTAMNGAGSETISMRGFGENSFGRVLVLIDGNKLNNPDMNGINWNSIDLANVERVEVLDGSASVLYGNNAVGGVINIITKSQGAKQTSFEFGGGSFFNNREAFSHFNPTSWGNFSASAEHTGSKGYRDRQESEITNANLGVTYNITDSLNLAAKAGFSSLYYQMPGSLLKAEYDDNPRQAQMGAYDDDGTERTVTSGLSLQWDPNDILKINLPLSYIGKFMEINMASYLLPSFLDRVNNTAEARPQISALLKPAGMSIRILGGLDFYYTNLDVVQYGAKDKTTETNSFDISQWSLAPYLSVNFEPIKILTISAGVRYDSAFVNAKNKDNSVDEEKIFHALVYDAGVVVRPIEKLKIYAKYASLFRYPFTDEMTSFYGYGTDEFFSNLEPEKGFNAEGGIGFKFNEIFSLNGNFYYTVMEDEIGLDPILLSAYTYKNINLDKTRRFGTDINLTITPIKYIELGASYSFVDAIFMEGDNKNKQIPLVPQHTVYAKLSGKLPFGLSFGPDFEYRTESYQGGDNANEQEKTDAYFLLGAFIRYKLEKHNFVVQVTAKNLLDQKYSSSIYYRNYMYDSAYYPGNGREINLALQYSF
ncbi:MAG: hypothetical protein Ta2G_14310 [Termitinemataceae bacterium]|nr:MAG: hypothetical protein Ta2G_14310 [Termitinemataceae bacterium]